ncbi:hypothetical protein N7G274_006769 [Stereocaulon virgatum]|uniref:Uncharacterized protein n=1 Tax=Stereocaulon virgatum TaxID=373712 RepID=A0ABR4A5Y8_9LECA
MSPSGRLPVNTANKDQSIWRGLDRDTFRRHIVALQQASAEVPSDPVVYSTNEWLASRSARYGKGYSLPFDVEQRIVDDIAFIAAAEEGPKEVSAVALEEQLGHKGLIFRVAANEKLPNGVENMLKTAFRLLSRCASRKLPRDACAQSFFDLILDVEKNRIYGRLESIHWKKPGSRIGAKERRPLYLELHKVAQRLKQHRFPVHAEASLLIRKIQELCDSLQAIDNVESNTDKGRLLLAKAIKESYDLCTSGGTSTLNETISRCGFDPADVCTNKYIRQLDKIGRYWGLCRSMTEDSRRYPVLFANIQLNVLRPYEGSSSQISYTGGQRARCLVHAEIQIIVFYGRNPNATILKPRVIGASKSACYLCNLFIQYHRQFFVTKTHGHLYERWNFPDLADFSQVERDEYRRVLEAMDRELQAATARESNARRRRGHPTGSWLTLPPTRQLSPVPSTVLSSGLEENVNADTIITNTPRAPFNSSTQNAKAVPIPLPTPTALSAVATPRSARAERLARRNLLKEVQATKKVPGNPEEPPTLTEPNLPEASPMTTQPPPADLSSLALKPNVDPPPPAPPPVASPVPSSLSTMALSIPPPVASPVPSSPSNMAPLAPPPVASLVASSPSNMAPSAPPPVASPVPSSLSTMALSAPPPAASPMPPSPPTPTPFAVAHNEHPKPRARIAAHKSPRPAPSTATELPSLPSTSSIPSWEYPIERTITASSPFRSKHGKLNLTVEIEGPSQGTVAITNISANKKPALGIPVNVKAMRENEILRFEKREDDDDVVLNLTRTSGTFTQITLHWI